MKLRELTTLLLQHDLGAEVVLNAAIAIDDKTLECSKELDIHVETIDGKVHIQMSGTFDTIYDCITDKVSSSQDITLTINEG